MARGSAPPAADDDKGMEGIAMENAAENKMGVMPIGKLVLNMSVPLMISMLCRRFTTSWTASLSAWSARRRSRRCPSAFGAEPDDRPGHGHGGGRQRALSRALGAGDRERANRVAEHGVFLSLVGYVVFLLFGIFGSRAFMLSQTHNMTIVEYGVTT